jgi:hypothetical protein
VTSLPRRILVLRLAIGVVIGLQSLHVALERTPAAGSHLAMLGGLVRGLAMLELVAALLLLAPWTARFGAWLLLGVLAFAIALHLLHGETNVAWLLVVAAALWVVLGESERPALGAAIKG